MKTVFGVNRGERQELVAILAGLPALGDCPLKELKRLADVGHAVRLPQGWSVVAEGTPGDGCYLLLSGQVAVTIRGEAVTVLEPGALFGEVGLLDQRLRTATVTARTPIRVLSMSYVDFAPLLAREPHLSATLLAAYRARTAGTE